MLAPCLELDKVWMSRYNKHLWVSEVISPLPCLMATSMRLCLREDLVGRCLEPRDLVTRDWGTVV